MDTDNPILMGTQKDVAWAAWQTSRQQTSEPENRHEFEMWWVLNRDFKWASTRAMVRAAWITSVRKPLGDPLDEFDHWWQQIVDGQPVVRDGG